MRVPLLPRLKAHGVATILSKPRGDSLSAGDTVERMREYSALKTNGSSGGTKSDAVAIDIANDLRKIAQKAGFPTSNTQAMRAQFDHDAAIYLAQLEALRTGEALRDDVWAFMTTVLAPDVVTWRFTEKKRERVARFTGGARNTFQRLWVRGSLLDRGEGHAQRWELLMQLTEDAMVQIFERASIAGVPSFAMAVAEGWLSTAAKVGRGPMEDIMRSATKMLRVKNQIIDLGYLTPQELEQIVLETFDSAAVFFITAQHKTNKSLDVHE
ncbi:DUF6339 family protein [Pseudomonas corrugata]|uniref:DUF6339 family protein n=1 Tax=Pseudomonas corrugata TaxID=47879 RepID=UPI0028C38345|nr:DUF6339 family protein [Pseudomonas corrugata]MDU9041947.1 DUF6339 family protein [Pseudomonas corrugata]